MKPSHFPIPDKPYLASLPSFDPTNPEANFAAHCLCSHGNEQFRRILLHPSVIMNTSERFMKGVNLFQGMINYSGIIYPRGIIYSRIDYPGDKFIGG